MSSNSAQYMAAYYSRKRSEVILLLGSKCALCGSQFNLEIDHVSGYSGNFSPNGSRGGMRNLWDAVKLIRSGRISELRLLCKTCNLSVRGGGCC